MQRRRFLASLLMVPPSVRLARAEAESDGWRQWVQSFVTDDGRVVDDGQGGISHSEGQGYGLLLAQAFGDRDTFERLESWAAANLCIRQDALMAWKWSTSGGVEEWQNATDGDLFRAWALLRAERDSGWGARMPLARAILDDVLALCVGTDPRTEDELLLTPGAEALRTPERLLVNPSYFLTRAMRELGDVIGDARLVRAADHGETLLAELAAAGMLPDWLTLTPEGITAPEHHAFRFGFDALRIPLYLVWSGRAAHPAVAMAMRLMERARSPGHLAVTLDPSGQVVAESNLPGFIAIRKLVRGTPVTVEAADIASQPYYPATLQLLCAVAQREAA